MTVRKVSNLRFIGPPGCGKRKLAEGFCPKWGAHHVDMSRLLHGLCDPEVDALMDEAELVPCATVKKALDRYLEHRSQGELRAYDGVPRTDVQWQMLDDVIGRQAVQDSRVIFFDISLAQSWRRIEMATDRGLRLDDKRKKKLCRRMSQYFAGLEGMIDRIEASDPIIVECALGQSPEQVLAYVESELGLSLVSPPRLQLVETEPPPIGD